MPKLTPEQLGINPVLALASRSWSLFPVDHPDNPMCIGTKTRQHDPATCTERGKHPVPQRWSQSSTSDLAQIRKWLDSPTRMNFAVDVSKSGLVILDEDTPGEFARFCESHGQSVPETFSATTGKGRHFYFGRPDGYAMSNTGRLKKLGFDMDVRANNGFAVVPGSKHASGASYNADDLNQPVADLPTWLADVLFAESSHETPQGTSTPTDNPPRDDLGLRTYEDRAVGGELARLDVLPRAWHEGAGWDTTTYEVACNLFEIANSAWSALSPDQVPSLVVAHAPTDQSWGLDRVHGKIDSARKTTAGKSRPEPAAPTARKVGQVRLDDSPLAEWCAERMEQFWCWAAGLGWMHFDGKVWREVTDAAVVEATRQLFRVLWQLEAERGTDPNRLKAISALLNSGKIRAVVGLLRGILEADPADFDRHPHLLNCNNGVVDLRTGELLDHRASLRLTKITKVDYRPDAMSRDWTAALTALTAEVADWMQVRFGQAATGHMTPDDVLPVLQGNGSNGKSTVVAAVMSALGDHAIVVPERVLLSNPSDHPTELTTLKGARLALIEETPEARHLSVKRLKDVLGTPTMTARRIRENNVTWEATHSLMLTSNYRPMVAETDHGTWRRLALVRFPFTFRPDGEQALTDNDRRGDPGLRERLRAGLEGQREAVLAWTVAGARRWFEDGQVMPATPAVVAEDTMAWRAESDLILAYVLDRLTFVPDSSALSTELFTDFNDWIVARGHRPWSDQTFTSRFGQHDELSRRGVTKGRTSATERLSRPGRAGGAPPPSKFTAWFGVAFQDTAGDRAGRTASTGQGVF